MFSIDPKVSDEKFTSEKRCKIETVTNQDDFKRLAAKIYADLFN